MPTNPHWKLRRLADRALRVYERTQHIHPTIAAYSHTLVPLAQAFIESYDSLRVLGQRRATERAEGLEATETLAKTTRGWALQIEALAIIEGFTVRDVAGKSTVPDDVLNDTRAFLRMIDEHLEVNPETIPFLDLMRSSIEPMLETASREWSEAEHARGAHSLAVVQNREAAAKLAPCLASFRRTLAQVLGRTNAEYQSLRANKVSRIEAVEEHEGEALSEGPVAPPATDPGDEPADATKDEEVTNRAS